MEILNSAQIAKADNYAIEYMGIPSTVLMENAASGIFQVIEKLDLGKGRIGIFAGSGNNGGDGIALARKCFNAGFKVELFLTTDSENLKGDPLINFKILEHYPIPVFNAFEDIIEDRYDLIVDSLFGTGLSRPLEGKYKKLVDKINSLGGIKLAVDIPSGLSGNTNALIGNCFKADITVTMCRPKIPHKLYPAKKFCGNVEVVDISIPDFAVENVEPYIYEITEKNIPKLSKREPDSHKGKFGHAVIIGGSPGKTGAPILASRSCARTGAGLTTIVLPSQLNLTAEISTAEIMSYPVGSLSYFREEDADDVLGFIEDKTVIGLGPGIGRDSNTISFTKKLIHQSNLPIVIDADGLYGLNEEDFNYLKYRSVITPHIGEFARLLKESKENVINRKLELSAEFAVKYGIVTVLKSADTIIANPDGKIFVLNRGTPALAKGGSGDCLTGIITSFISQGHSLNDAAILGSWIFGKTAEHLTEKYNERFLLTGDIINNLWIVLNELYRNK